jgi:hypothetical protein
VGLHEGTSLSDVTPQFEALRQFLGPERVTILGILSDEAVAEELNAADYVLAFFEQGIRANNTTVHAAVDAGCRVITNFDERTSMLRHPRLLDIGALTVWPGTEWTSPYSWDNLLVEMEAIYARTHDREPQNI